MATSGKRSRPATKASISRFGVTPPVGLAGEFTMTSRVFGPSSDRASSAENAKPFSSRTGSGTGTAPVNSIIER